MKSLHEWDQHELVAGLLKRNVLDHLIKLLVDNGVTGAMIAEGLLFIIPVAKVLVLCILEDYYSSDTILFSLHSLTDLAAGCGVTCSQPLSSLVDGEKYDTYLT